MKISRRQALATTAACLVGIRTAQADRKPVTGRMTLGFSTYGMKTMELEKALDVIAEIGYESVEICVRPEWDGAPARLSKSRRSEIRKRIEQSGLRLTALMEHLPPAVAEAEHQQQLERLRGVFELANDLAVGKPPLMQTVLGDGDWESKKNFLRDRVGAWVRLSEQQGVVTCIKPHRGGSMSKPSDALWIIQQLNEPRWLRFVYDYSHYIYRDIPLVESLQTSLPFVAHVAVKDTVMKDGKASFELPGSAGTIDFALLFKTLKAGGYQGDISCEVSGMLWNKPDYEPITAAKTCYQNLIKTFRETTGTVP